MTVSLDTTVKPVQSVETEAEKIALEVAQEWLDNGREAASDMLQKIILEKGLVYGEGSAISSIVMRMVNGRSWKK